MLVSETLSNQMCRNSTVATHALADASDLGLFAVAGGHAVEAPAQGVVSDPALFAAGWSNPNSSLSVGVVNEQGPFGLEFGDFAVGNDDGVKGIHNDQIFVAQNQLWSNPDQGSDAAENKCCGNVDNENASGGWVENTLSQEQGHKSQSNVSKNKISLRAVNRQVLHSSIIAGTPVVGKGK